MDRSTQITLVTTSYTTDSIGQFVPTETNTTIFCNVRSVTRAEWAAAGQNGLKPELVATIFSPEYNGAEIAIIDGVRYGIYRTYLDTGERLELYLERKAGVTNG